MNNKMEGYHNELNRNIIDEDVSSNINKFKRYNDCSYKYNACSYNFNGITNWSDYHKYKKLKYDYFKITEKEVRELCKINLLKKRGSCNKSELVDILINNKILDESYRKPNRIQITKEDVDKFMLIDK